MVIPDSEELFFSEVYIKFMPDSCPILVFTFMRCFTKTQYQYSVFLVDPPWSNIRCVHGNFKMGHSWEICVHTRGEKKLSKLHWFTQHLLPQICGNSISKTQTVKNVVVQPIAALNLQGRPTVPRVSEGVWKFCGIFFTKSLLNFA